MREQYDVLESLFVADAKQAGREAPPVPIRPVIAPAVAAQAARLRRRQKQRREWLLLLAIGIPVFGMLLAAALAWLRGEQQLMRLLMIPAGICGLLALLTLPLIEKFQTQAKQPGRTGAMPVR